MASAAGTITGVKGEIRWHWYPAADVFNYVVTWHKTEKQWTVSGTVPFHDRFKMAQQPLTFVTLRKTRETGEPREWSWPLTWFELKDGHFVGTLGALNKKSGTKKRETNSHAVSICTTQDYPPTPGGRRAAYLARAHQQDRR